ncbi:hypothetical protein M3Y96_00146200 [Aphelenchoides besseyi]|nr:hypothetical protein M3Y96_00146200 [Aphelenchoides besseyi]
MHFFLRIPTSIRQVVCWLFNRSLQFGFASKGPRGYVDVYVHNQRRALRSLGTYRRIIKTVETNQNDGTWQLKRKPHTLNLPVNLAKVLHDFCKKQETTMNKLLEKWNAEFYPAIQRLAQQQLTTYKLQEISCLSREFEREEACDLKVIGIESGGRKEQITVCCEN